MATISLKLKLKPFAVPTHVTIELPPGRKQDGMQPLPTIPLSELDAESLAALIEEFSESVLRAAGQIVDGPEE